MTGAAARRMGALLSHVRPAAGSAAAAAAHPRGRDLPSAGELREVASAVQAAYASDRASDDSGGMVWFEHVNLVVADRYQAEVFYFSCLGFTRDPARDVGDTMWANLGRQQMHLPISQGGTPQVLPGHIGIAVPSLPALRRRLASPPVPEALAGTLFAWRDDGDCVVVRCPWGNIFAVYAAAPPPPAIPLPAGAPMMDRMHHGWQASMGVQGVHPGIRYVQLDARDGPAVGEWYRANLDANVWCRGGIACVEAGPGTHIVFTTRGGEPVADHGVHVAHYISPFRSAYHRIKELGAIWTNPRFKRLDRCDTWEEALAGRQFRFKDIRAKDGTLLVELEHETRTTRHAQYAKSLYYVSR
eukprot:TRINITY_DN19810_c0_g1_i1.p1 TRINITY_DN19810_c0_g1~~TRINITY_DN19810_c0_g1_i1.p1  ORF type:complete len:383 (+),score=94.29 TRINITY_DN19810_c0_g1_i1:80-1150(+)